MEFGKKREIVDKNGSVGSQIYVLAAALPITFTGYDVTDLKIKATSSSATLGITAWR